MHVTYLLSLTAKYPQSFLRKSLRSIFYDDLAQKLKWVGMEWTEQRIPLIDKLDLALDVNQITLMLSECGSETNFDFGQNVRKYVSVTNPLRI